MFKELIVYIAGKIKGEPYKISKHIGSRDLFLFLALRGGMLLRGVLYLRSFVFLGRNVALKYNHRLELGKYVTLNEGIEIDALSVNGVSLGSNVSIGKNSFFRCTAGLGELGEGLRIEENVGIGSNTYFGCWGGIVIGKNTICGERLTIHSDNHNFDDDSKLIRYQGAIKLPVNIGENCWFGSNVTVLGGVTVGNGCVIGACSVITKDVPANSVVVGNPAKVIKSRVLVKH